VLSIIAEYFQKVRCDAPFLGQPENITDINRDGATVRFAPGMVVTRRFVRAVNVPSDEYCSGIQEQDAGG
jgi:hypothetical protein